MINLKSITRKASLQLSINAIVVLILAITILGLGLNFIKNNFGAVEQQFGTVSEELQDEMVEKIKESGELLVFNKLELDLKKGNPEKFYIGIKNTDAAAACFNISFECQTPQTAGTFCDGAALNYISATTGAADSLNWFSLFQQKEVKSGETFVTPVDLLIPTAASDTYLMRVYVRKGPSGCAAAGTWVDYAEKDFFINLA